MKFALIHFPRPQSIQHRANGWMLLCAGGNPLCGWSGCLVVQPGIARRAAQAGAASSDRFRPSLQEHAQSGLVDPSLGAGAWNSTLSASGFPPPPVDQLPMHNRTDPVALMILWPKRIQTTTLTQRYSQHSSDLNVRWLLRLQRHVSLS